MGGTVSASPRRTASITSRALAINLVCSANERLAAGEQVTTAARAIEVKYGAIRIFQLRLCKSVRNESCRSRSSAAGRLTTL